MEGVGEANNGTQRRRQPYNTRSNKVRVVRTPGGELRYLHNKKKGTAPKCGDCGTKLPGVCPPISYSKEGTRLTWWLRD